MAAAVETTEIVRTHIHVFNPVGDPKVNNSHRSLGTFLRTRQKDLPADGTHVFRCEVEPAPGVQLTAHAWGSHIFVEANTQTWHPWVSNGRNLDADEPFITARIVSDKAYFKRIRQTKRVELTAEERQRREALYRQRGRYQRAPVWEDREVEDFHCYSRTGQYYGTVIEETPYAYLKIEISAPGADPVVGEFHFQQPVHGVAKLSDDPKSGEVTTTTNFFGVTRTLSESIHLKTTHHKYKRNYQAYGRDHYYTETNNPLLVLCLHLRNSECPDGADEWWRRFFEDHPLPAVPDTKGVISLLKRKAIAPNIERLKAETPLEHTFLVWLFDSKTQDKQRNNSLIGTMLRQIGADYDKLLAALQQARHDAIHLSGAGSYHYGNSRRDYFDFRRQVCLNLPGAKEKIAEQEAKADYRKRKTAAGQAEGLGLDKAKYPKLFRYVEAGNIPISVFANPDKQPVNREFALWEKALKRKGWAEEINNIAADASRRSTYEKDITPYLAFLFRLEKYLRRHTKKSWRAMPKFVSSQWELEMDDAQGGTTKRRSAFTPVADNETRIVTVPYVAVCVSGVRTQWCYSQYYYVFEEGMIDPESGGVVVNEIEKGLNGRDDYGLMYFTLTGTMTARGYPTFLIIFERRYKGIDIAHDPVVKTFVHFHRVHPCRSKNRIRTLACELIGKCYQYMAGNVPAEDVAAQQGDLIFIRHPNDPIKAKAKVEDPKTSSEALVFESHAMMPIEAAARTAEMNLYVSTAKTPKNRLGFLHMDVPWQVKHPEHDDIEEMAPGWWEIRRCRSYENNPRAQWSLTID